MTGQFPLNWPNGEERTKYPVRSNFSKKTFGRVRNELIKEIQRIGAESAIMSCNLELRQDGLPYSTRRQPDDSGVALYFNFEGEPKAICCDKWKTVEENIWSIINTIKAIRAIERWGTSNIKNKILSGLKQLPEAGAPREIFYRATGTHPKSTVDEVTTAWRNWIKDNHPDKGGDTDLYLEMNESYLKCRDLSLKT